MLSTLRRWMMAPGNTVETQTTPTVRPMIPGRDWEYLFRPGIVVVRYHPLSIRHACASSHTTRPSLSVSRSGEMRIPFQIFLWKLARRTPIWKSPTT